jgi:hypothetical protein
VGRTGGNRVKSGQRRRPPPDRLSPVVRPPTPSVGFADSSPEGEHRGGRSHLPPLGEDGCVAARRGQVRGSSPLHPRRISHKPQPNQHPAKISHRAIRRAQNAPHNHPTSSRGKGARPATEAAAGGGRAGLGSRGILDRSGDLVAGQTRPPSAWMRITGCVH